MYKGIICAILIVVGCSQPPNIKEYHPDYRQGYIDAYVGLPSTLDRYIIPPTTDNYEKGYQDGKRARETK